MDCLAVYSIGWPKTNRRKFYLRVIRNVRDPVKQEKDIHKLVWDEVSVLAEQENPGDWHFAGCLNEIIRPIPVDQDHFDLDPNVLSLDLASSHEGQAE